MTKDHEIPAIFNPNPAPRVRAPSVVITNDSPNGSSPSGGFANMLHTSNPQIARSDSISQPNATEVSVEVSVCGALQRRALALLECLNAFGCVLQVPQTTPMPITAVPATSTSTTSTSTTTTVSTNNGNVSCSLRALCLYFGRF